MQFSSLLGCELSSKVPFYTFQGDEEEDLEHFLELRTVCTLKCEHFFSSPEVKGVQIASWFAVKIRYGNNVKIFSASCRFVSVKAPKRRATWWK